MTEQSAEADVERVARALFCDSQGEWKSFNNANQAPWLRAARAALAAMPTPPVAPPLSDEEMREILAGQYEEFFGVGSQKRKIS